MQNIVEFIQEIYNTKEFIPLHEPRFIGNEKKYLIDTIDCLENKPLFIWR